MSWSARSLNSPVADQRGEFVYLYEITHSGGTIRVTNSSADISALSQTWTAIGGALLHGAPPETSDRKAQGVQLSLYGVNQQVISAIQSNQFRGQLIKIYLVHFDVDTGVIDTPDLIFQGRQNGDYQISESRDFESTDSGGAVTVSTRVTADTASINNKVSTRCNVPSHQELLRRAGLTATDEFFRRVPSLTNQPVFWGGDIPIGGTGQAGGSGQPDDAYEAIWWI
jgi:hypothetical protein